MIKLIFCCKDNIIPVNRKKEIPIPSWGISYSYS